MDDNCYDLCKGSWGFRYNYCIKKCSDFYFSTLNRGINIGHNMSLINSYQLGWWNGYRNGKEDGINSFKNNINLVLNSANLDYTKGFNEGFYTVYPYHDYYVIILKLFLFICITFFLKKIINLNKIVSFYKSIIPIIKISSKSPFSKICIVCGDESNTIYNYSNCNRSMFIHDNCAKPLINKKCVFCRKDYNKLNKLFLNYME